MSEAAKEDIVNSRGREEVGVTSQQPQTGARRRFATAHGLLQAVALLRSYLAAGLHLSFYVSNALQRNSDKPISDT